MVLKKEDQFLIDLLNYYKETIGSAVTSVVLLKNIQTAFPDKYEELLAVQEDPSRLIDMAGKLGAEDSKILFELMIRASSLSRKINQVFELSVQDKDMLIKELKDFSEVMEKSIVLLQK